MRLPEWVSPMLATSGLPPTDEGWAYEFKLEGLRAIIAAGDGRVRITSRTGTSLTRAYPDLVVLGDRVTTPVLLDGEIIAQDEQGRPAFDLLQRRMATGNPSEALQNRVPVAYYAFDLLVQGKRNLMEEPYHRRRERLWALELGLPVHVPYAHDDLEPEYLLGMAEQHGLEGLVSKHTDAHYHPGVRSKWWVKTPLRHTHDVIVGGYLEGHGKQGGQPGSLLLGVYDTRGLRHIGDVRSGLTTKLIAAMSQAFKGIGRDTSPFLDPLPPAQERRAHWLDPILVGEVDYRSWSATGHLRHPSWLGFRPDRRAEDITLSTWTPMIT